MNTEIDKGDGGPETIRRFVDLNIQESVDRAIKRLEDTDKTTAVVLLADKDSAKVAYMHRLPKGWSAMVVVEKPWEGQAEFQAVLTWSH